MSFRHLVKAANAASFGWQLSGSRSYLAAQVPALIEAPVEPPWPRDAFEVVFAPVIELELVITPEYNHSVPGVLKNAIDSVWVSFAFRNKPIMTVGYSGGMAGGVRTIEHLAQIAIEAVPLLKTLSLPPT
jgi:hypothetical protein